MLGLLRGRDIKAELARRGKGHLGVWAAMLMWASKVESSNDEVKAILDKLRAFAWRTTRRRLCLIGCARDVGDMYKDLSSEIAMLVLSRWGDIRLDQAMIQALEGKFDILVSAVADTVVKRKRGEFHQEKIKSGVSAAEKVVEASRVLSARLPLHPAAISPLGLKVLEAYRKGARTEQEVAEFHGVTARTVRNWLSKLKASYRP